MSFARSDFRFLHRLRVRWAEVDLQKIVFNPHYLMYLDTALADYWRAMGLPYEPTLAALGGELFVKKATLEYHASAVYDDYLDVGLRCARVGNTSFQLQGGIFRGDQLLVGADLVHVFADPLSRTPLTVPTVLRQTMEVFEKDDSRLVKVVENADDAVDRLHEVIKLYLIQASRAELSEEEGRRYVEILSFTMNLEHVGDIVDKNLMELAAKKIKNRYAFSPEGLAELKAFHSLVIENLRLALNVFTTRDIALARRLIAEKTAMREAETKAAESHFARLREGRPESIETSSIHMDVIRDLKRINGHLTSVAYPILETAGELADTRLKTAQPLMRAPAGS